MKVQQAAGHIVIKLLKVLEDNEFITEDEHKTALMAVEAISMTICDELVKMTTPYYSPLIEVIAFGAIPKERVEELMDMSCDWQQGIRKQEVPIPDEVFVLMRRWITSKHRHPQIINLFTSLVSLADIWKLLTAPPVVKDHGFVKYSY